MSKNPPSENSIEDEFHTLSQNLIKTLRAAWNSPDRRRIQAEIEEGLADLATTVKMEVDTFNESPTGQRLKSDVEDLRERVHTGETETKVREEIIKALRLVNREIENVASTWSSTEETPETDSSPPPEGGEDV